MARGRGSGRRGGAHVDGDGIGGQLVASADVLPNEVYDRQSHLLLEGIGDGFLLVNEEGRLTYVSSTVEQVLGMRREALLGRQAWEVFPEDIGLPFLQHCRRVMAEHISIQFDARHQSPDLWLDLRLLPLPDGGVAAYVSDITDRKREERDRKREERDLTRRLAELERIFDAMPDAVTVYDAKGRMVRVNAAARALLGLDTNQAPVRTRGPTSYQQRLELLDESLRPLPPEAGAALRILRGETFSGNQTLDVRARTFDGQLLDLATSGAPIRQPKGRSIQGGVAITRDVTQQRVHERRMRHALQSLLKMTALVVGLDADEALGRETRAGNAHAATGVPTVQLEPIMRRLAESRGEVLGCVRVSFTAADAKTGLLRPLTRVAWSLEDVSEYGPEGDERRVPLSDRMSLDLIEQLHAGEVIVLDQNAIVPGLRQPATMVEVVVPLHVGTSFLGVLSLDCSTTPQLDAPQILAWAEASAQIASLVMELELAQPTVVERMDALVELAAHDLRSPLSAAKMAVQYCVRGAEHLVAALRGSMRERVSDEAMAIATVSRRTLGDATWALERMDYLVRRLFDTSRLSSGNLKLDTKRVDLRTIVRESIHAIQLTAPNRIIQFVEPRRRVEAVSVVADAARIGEVVTNYLDNALRYSSSVPHRPVEVTLLVQKGVVRVEVRDEGQGIPADKLDSIWDRFARADEDPDKVNPEGGLGLGLYICRSIIKLHRGQVGVESYLGHGSTFWFTLPLIPQSVRSSTPIRTSGLVFGF